MSENATCALEKHEVTSIQIPIAPSMQEIESLKEIGKVAAYSGFLNSNAPLREEYIIQRSADAFFVIMLGRELGIPAMTSLRNIYVIDGKPACNGQMMLALMRRGGVEIEIPNPSTVTDSATVRIKRPDTGQWAEYTYTKAMAEKANLWGRNTWSKYPAMMLIWRAVSMGNRFETPDITGGLHTVEELAPDTPVDEEGTPVGDIIIGKAVPPKQTAPATKNGNGSSGPSKANTAPSNITDFPVLSWLDKKDSKEQTGEQTLLTWLRQKYEMTGEEALKLVGKATWTDFPDGTAACNAVVAALENAAPAKTKTELANANGVGGWTDEQELALSEAIWGNFNKLNSEVLQALDKKNFRTDYPSYAKAWDAVRGVALAKQWDLVVDKATYNGQYITFKGAFAVRVYGRSTKFKDMVGEAYYTANHIDDWEQGNTVYEIEPLTITWKRKDGKNPYLLATAAKPVFDDTLEPTTEDDPELADVLEFFGGQS